MRWGRIAFTVFAIYSSSHAIAQDLDDYVESDYERAARHTRQARREQIRAETRIKLTGRTRESIERIMSNLNARISSGGYITDVGYGKYHFDKASIISTINETTIVVENALGELPYADKDVSGKRVVHIPIGFVLALDAVNLAIGQSVCCGGQISYQLKPWLETFQDKASSVFRRIAIDRKYHTKDQDEKASKLYNDIAWRPKMLCQSAGFNLLECDQIVRSDTNVQNTYGMATDASLGYIVMHELGHHILRHVEGDDNRKDSVKLKEIMADKLAVDLFWSSGLNPDYMLGGIILLALAEEAAREAELDEHPVAGKGAYPQTECRIWLAWNRALQRVNDSGFLGYLEQRGESETAIKLKQLAIFASNKAKSCPDYPNYQ